MNIDPFGPETSNQIIIWSDDFAKNFVQTRSYRCTFCKRGFSNAQALGGHMNIHRKDRAKLKEFSSENLLSLDITKSSDCEDKSSASEMDRDQTKRQSTSDEESDDLHDQIMKENNLVESLPLFEEAPGAKSGDREGGNFDKHVVGRKVENYGELDLELRLGPEPHDTKSKP